jgi:hypothetical protein
MLPGHLLKTHGGWRETPQDHPAGVYDVRQLFDEEPERMIVDHQTALGYPRAFPAVWFLIPLGYRRPRGPGRHVTPGPAYMPG